MHRQRHLLALGAAAALVVSGCGASAEPAAEDFYTAHAGEAASTSRAVGRVETKLAALLASPSRSSAEALAVGAHAARRGLLAAAQWTISENGEEEGVSQAEREINEGAGAMLTAMTAARQYADTGRGVALERYRYELNGGRERWNQGLAELWHLSHRAAPPRV